MGHNDSKITKIEAAERQLKQAIRLFFERVDDISVFTLVGASHGILTDLIKKEGKINLLTETPYIRTERKSDWLKIIKKPINFFKHADKDPEDVIELDEKIIPYYIIDCICMHQELTGRNLYSGVVFFSWFCLRYPELLMKSPWKDRSIEEVKKRLSPLDYEKWRRMLDISELLSNYGPFMPEQWKRDLEKLLILN